MSKKRPLVVVGFPGAGKTTLGRRCQELFGWTCLDVDEEVERRAGRTITELIRVEGEQAFRALERTVILEALAGAAEFVTLGGGALLNEATREELKTTATVVLLEVSQEVATERIYQEQRVATAAGRGTLRPLLASSNSERWDREELQAKVEALMQARRGIYDIAHIRLSTDGMEPDEVALLLRQKLSELEMTRQSTEEV